MTRLSVERIESEEALAALEPEWQELERASGNTLPFRTFIWASCWWKHLREDRLAVRDKMAFRAVRSSDGRLVGIAPFMLTERPRFGPIRVRCLQLIGADPNVTEVRGALCDPALAPECYRAITEELTQSTEGVDWVHWTGIGQEAGDALDDGFVRRSEPVVCCVLNLPASWEELRSSRPQNLKESLRKCYNSLKREGRTFSLDVTTHVAQVSASVEDFFRLHAARAALGDTIRHADVFQDSSCRGFLLDVCERFAQKNALRIFRLRIDGALAATRIGFALGDSLYLYYSGFDPTHAKYGVMTTTIAEAIKFAIGAGVRSVNLSTGRDVSKTRWRPEEVAFNDAFFMPSVLGRFKYQAAGAASRALKQAMARYPMHRFLARRSPDLRLLEQEQS